MKNKIKRIYIKNNFYLNQVFCLSKEHIHYVKNVLRMTIKDGLEIFNDTNYVFFANIIEISRKIIKCKILKKKLADLESPLCIHLGQVICKNKKMDLIIEKSTELSVNIITPLFSEYSNYQKKFIDTSNKIKHWQQIAISSCQQCHRNKLPKIYVPENIFLWCTKNTPNYVKIILDPKSQLTIDHLPKSIKYIQILIGSEGGFSNSEIEKIIQSGFTPIKLGPRILRTETATVAALTMLQIKYGDLSM